MFMSASNFRCRTSTSTCRSSASSTTRRRTWTSAWSSSSTAGTSTGCRWTSSSATVPHRQHRPPPRQHPLRDRQPASTPQASCTAEILWELARARRRDHAVDGRGAVHRADHRHRPFMYENTGARAHTMAAELIEAGVDVSGSTAASTRTCRSARLLSARARAAAVRALRRRRADGDRSDARRLRGDRRGRVRLRGHRRSPALGRGHEGRRAGARAAAGDRDGMRKSLRSTDGTVDVSRDRTRARRRWAPPGRGRVVRAPARRAPSRRFARRSHEQL